MPSRAPCVRSSALLVVCALVASGTTSAQNFAWVRLSRYLTTGGQVTVIDTRADTDPATPVSQTASLNTVQVLPPAFYQLIVQVRANAATPTGQTPPELSAGTRCSLDAVLAFSNQPTVLGASPHQFSGGSAAGVTSDMVLLNPVLDFSVADISSAFDPPAAPTSFANGTASFAGTVVTNAWTFQGAVDVQARRSNSGQASGAGYDAYVNLFFTLTQTTTLTATGTFAAELRGQSQQFPRLPNVFPGTFQFAPSGAWFDPPLALGYDFQQLGGSLFTDILTLPVGIDGDGLFEVLVGNQSLGQFAAGTGVDFVQLLGNGVSAFRIVGIGPAVDATDVEAFPVKLAFDTPVADFTMTPVTWRALGTSCAEAICPQCPATSLAPVGEALEGNLSFGLALANGPTNGVAAFFVGLGNAAPNPMPLFCGSVHLPLQTAVFDVGVAALAGTGTCDGSGSIPVPLVPVPPLFGLFLTMQAVTLCPAGGLGLTHAIEFPVGS